MSEQNLDDKFFETENKTIGAASADVLAYTANGNFSSAMGETLFGINHRQTLPPISINKDTFGLTFFTRPSLNLSSSNLRTDRKMSSMLTTKETSLPRVIRSYLDMRLARASPAITCPFVDEQQAFIPLLTNHLISMAGWPDISVPSFTSQAGIYKEVYGMVDGIVDHYEEFNITANFRNMPGDPITALFLAWVRYQSNVALGVMVPYPDMIILNEIDYNTRIYRLVLDADKRFVQKIAACGAAYPEGVPIGAAFNFETSTPINNSADQISVSFKCFGAMYQDDILVDEFNRTTELFNFGMTDANRGKLYRKVPIEALGVFNNVGYPRINLDTYELEWYVDVNLFQSKLPLLNEKISATGSLLSVTPDGKTVKK